MRTASGMMVRAAARSHGMRRGYMVPMPLCVWLGYRAPRSLPARFRPRSFRDRDQHDCTAPGAQRRRQELSEAKLGRATSLQRVSSFVRPGSVLSSRPCIAAAHGAQWRSRPAILSARRRMAAPLCGVALTAASTVRRSRQCADQNASSGSIVRNCTIAFGSLVGGKCTSAG